jgi:hypothetical protein
MNRGVVGFIAKSGDMLRVLDTEQSLSRFRAKPSADPGILPQTRSRNPETATHSAKAEISNLIAHRSSLIAHRSPLTAHRSPLIIIQHSGVPILPAEKTA